MARINNAYMTPLRRACGVTYKDGRPNVSGREVRAMSRAPPVGAALRIARLAAVPRIVSRAPAATLVLLDTEGEWTRCLRDDFAWLRKIFGAAHRDLPDTFKCDVDGWPALAAEHRCAWKGMVKQAKALAIAQDRAEEAPPEAPDVLIQCPDCGSACKGARALATHRRNRHGHYPDVAFYCFGSRCLACQWEYFARKRLIQHLTYGRPACLRAIMANVAPQEPEEVEKLRGADTARRKREASRRAVFLPALRAAGPSPRWAVT